jgi:hypothetical protein
VCLRRGVQEVAERQRVPFRVMACTTSIHTELPDVDAPPLMLDPAVLSSVEPGVWPWHLVVFLGTGTDARLLDLTAGRFGAVWPVPAKPGLVARGPDGSGACGRRLPVYPVSAGRIDRRQKEQARSLCLSGP